MNKFYGNYMFLVRMVGYIANFHAGVATNLERDDISVGLRGRIGWWPIPGGCPDRTGGPQLE